MRNSSKITLSLFVLFASSFGCAPEPVQRNVDSCSSSSSSVEINQADQIFSVAAGAAVGQHLQSFNDTSITRVMFRVASAGLTSVTLTIYEDASYADSTIASAPVVSHVFNVNHSSSDLESLWLTLPTPFALKGGGKKYFFGLVPNAAIKMGWSTMTVNARSQRAYYRTGTGTGGPGGGPNWSTPETQKIMSFGLENEWPCFLK